MFKNRRDGSGKTGAFFPVQAWYLSVAAVGGTAYYGTSGAKAAGANTHSQGHFPAVLRAGRQSLNFLSAEKGINMFCNNCNGSLWIIILIIILFCGCGNGWGSGCGCGNGCGCDNNCGCNNNCGCC